MIEPKCPNCETTTVPKFKAVDQNKRISDEVFDYFECPRCHLVFLDPIPEDLDRYYPKNYYGGFPPLDELKRIVDGERYKLEMVKEYSSGGKLLELGPGGGGFAYLAKEAGYDVDVIETSPESCDYLANVVGVGVTQSAETEAAIL